MYTETPHHPLGPLGPSDGFPAGSLGATWGEAVEASFGVPPSVLTLRVNRNIKSLLGGQETGNNQNTVSCPRPGRWAACHPPSPALQPGAFPALSPPPPSALWARVPAGAHAPGYN